jgi:squalene-hopene/tetraprenyl-beta-curcumene cyclase
LDLQNRDSGWPTFCKGWGKFPFDRSGSDITAHSIRALLAWKTHHDSPRLTKAIDRGFRYLERQQRADGSWLPLWFGNQDTEDEINPWYGTAKVLLAYADAKLFDTETAKFGLEWVVESQNEDGGWGGGDSLNWAALRATFKPEFTETELIETEPNRIDRLGHSSVEETALCTEILLRYLAERKTPDPFRNQVVAAANAGINWLITAVELECISIHWPIGFYFAKLWYYEQMYPLIFAAGALTQALNTVTESGTSSTNDAPVPQQTTYANE